MYPMHSYAAMLCVCVQKVGKDPILPVKTLDTFGLFSRAGIGTHTT